MSLPQRILTKKFEALRSNVRSRTRSPSSSADFRLGPSQSDHGAKLLDKGATEEKERISGPVFALPPEWVDIVDNIQKDLIKAKENTKALVRLHNLRLKVSFGDEKIAEQERDIEILTQDITRLLRKSENNLKRIALVGSDAGKLLTPQERTQRLNVMRAFAAELQLLSKQFRQAQKEFLKNLREQQQLGVSFGFADGDSDGEKSNATLDEALDRGLSPEQAAQLKVLAERSDERYREIVKIAQSVSDLASLFRELNVLVIEQGSLIDRIDYNMEQAAVRVAAGTEELEKADEYSKKAYTFKCILVLLAILALLIGILIYKKS